jgi:hypothetical protein
LVEKWNWDTHIQRHYGDVIYLILSLDKGRCDLIIL